MPSVSRPSLFWSFLVLGSLVGAALPSPTSDIVLGVVVASALAVTVGSVRRLGGSRGWRLIMVGSMCFGLAPVATEVHRLIQSDVGPATFGDVFLVLAYGLFIVGIRAVLVARTMAPQTRATLDAAMVALWFGFGAVALFGPQLASRLSGFDLAHAVLYLPLSLIIVHLNLRVVLGSNSRSGSVLLLGFGAASTMTSELGFLAAAAGYQGARQVGVAAASLAIVGLAAAIRHPSAAEIEDPVAGQRLLLTLARSWWLVLSFVAVAGSLLWFPRPDVPLAGLLVAVGALTTYNLFATIQERERLILIERTLRLSLAEVIQATTPPTILELSGRSADRLLADKSHVEVELLRRDGSDWVSCPEGATTKLGSDVEPLVDEAVLSGHHVRRELRSDLPGVGYVTRLAIPLADGGDHAEVLLTEVSPVLTTVEIEQLFQLAGATSRALVAYELTEATHQRRADRRFRALVQDSNDVVAIVDPESKDVTMISPSLERILGHRNDVFIGGPMGPHLHPEDADQVDELLRTAVTRPQTGAVDVRLRHDGGHYHWFSALVRDHTDDDDVGGLVLNLTDIHRRKLAELSLGFSEQRYRALVLNSRDVFAILEHDLTVNYISPNVETVLGYPAADLMATDMATLLPDSSSARLRELIEAAGDVISNEMVELEVRTRTGDIRIAEVTVSNRDDESGFLLTINDVTERRQLERHLRNQALYDSLTGLANRSTLHHDLQQMLQGLEPGRCLGLLHIDLADLKSVHQSLGFEAGDELLIQVATRLRSRLRSNDLLARVGSTELAVVAEGESPEDIERLAALVQLQFEDPFPVAGRTWRLGVAIGIDVTSDRATVASEFITQSSLAAAAVLAGSGTGSRRFEPSLRSDATTRFELAADLDGAMAADELHVVYQPILEIESSTVRGVEALLRWTHPNRGPI